jgi:tetratricopeptide (TPR) repeat protein
MNESSLLAYGALKTQCLESLMGYCSCVGNKWTEQEMVDSKCPNCGEPIAKFVCGRCDGEFTARSVSAEHTCQSVKAYQASGKIAFEEEGRAAREAQQRADAVERDRARHIEELERRARQSEIHATEVEKAKAEEVEAAVRRAKEAEDRLAATEAALRESASRVPYYPPLKSSPTKTLRRWSWVMLIVVVGAWGYLGSSKTPPRAQTPANISIGTQKQPTAEQTAPGIPSATTSKFPRCAGSYEPKKCEEFESQLLNESAEAKAARIASLDQNRQSAMNEVTGGFQGENTVSNPAKEDEGKPTTAAKEQVPEVGPAALTALTHIVQAINARQSLADQPRPGVIAEVDEALLALANLPKPTRGDRRAARTHLASGLALLAQDGMGAAAADTLLKAHQADPLDVQILNDLAYAELSIGRYPSAREHLLQVLTMAPTRTSAWVNLAELRAALAKEDQKVLEDVVRFYIVGYWFSSDRLKTIQYLREKAASQPVGTLLTRASEITLQRLSMLDKIQ